MSEYSIQHGEVIVLREELVFDRRKNSINIPRGELMLTTNAIVFSRTNIFRKITDFEVFPLKNIQIFNDEPQVKVGSYSGMKYLEIYMTDGEILKFSIGEGITKGAVLKWVNAIYKVITGHEYTEYDKSAFALPGMQAVANYAGGTLDVFKKSFGFKKQAPEIVVKYCQNCGAQIKGRSGDIGRCNFCGSSQKL